MRRAILRILIGFLATISSSALATEFVILSPPTQAFARQIIQMEGTRFRFNENDASVAGYIAFATFIETTSNHIAHLRETDPGMSDRIVAAWLFCLFPPFKPPVEKPKLEERFNHIERAYYSHKLRERIRNAIGKRPVQLATQIDSKFGRPQLSSWAYEFSLDSVVAVVERVPALQKLPTEDDFDWARMK